MNLNDLKTSRFLKKEDVEPPVPVTIHSITKQNVAMEGADPDLRAVIQFKELDKPMVLNSTNGQLIARIAGTTEDIENSWPGTVVVLYNDPNVSFAGKLVGGIRIRAPKAGYQQPQATEQSPHDDDLPF